MAVFVMENGYRAINAFENTPGTIINCFGTGSLSDKIDPSSPAFGGASRREGSIYSMVPESTTVNCFYNTDTNPGPLYSETRIPGDFGLTTQEMQS